MTLLAYQTALGRMVRAPKVHMEKTDWCADLDLNSHERSRLQRLANSEGFAFTIKIQRSWCDGRARNAAFLTLAQFAPDMQQDILDEWVALGGGTAAYFAREADAFLDFISGYLEPRSHHMSICRLEQAVHRASVGAQEHRPPLHELESGQQLFRGAHASLVEFFINPDRLFSMLDNGEPLPPLEARSTYLLFAPGIPGLFRIATDEEVSFWHSFAYPAPFSLVDLDPQRRAVLDGMYEIGALTPV